MSVSEIPTLGFRIEPAFTMAHKLLGPQIAQDNLLVGQLRAGSQAQALYLGKVAEYQNMRVNAWLDFEGAHAVYVMGKRRSGKTYTLGTLAEGLVANTWVRQGVGTQAVLIVDSMNVFVSMPHLVNPTYPFEHPVREELRRWKIPTEQLPVVLYYPRGTARPAEGNSVEISIRASDLSAEDWAALFEVDTFSDPMGHLLGELYEKVAMEGYLDHDGRYIPRNADYSIADLLECLLQSAEVDRYEQRTKEAVRRRLQSVRRLPVFGESGIDLRDLFRPGQISILLVRDIDQQVRALLIGIIAKQIMQWRSVTDRLERQAAIYRQQAIREAEPSEVNQQQAETRYREYSSQIESGLSRGWLIIDEAHNFLPSRGIVASSAPLKKFVNEGRNLGLSIVVATQNPSGLDPAIRRNADVLLIHSMSMRDDISTAEGMVNTLVPDSFEIGGERVTARVFEQLVRSLPPGYAVISNDVINRVFVTKIRPRATVHGAVEY